MQKGQKRDTGASFCCETFNETFKRTPASVLEDKETVIWEKRFKPFGIVSICQTTADIAEPDSPEGISGKSYKSISAPKKSPKVWQETIKCRTKEGEGCSQEHGPSN